MNSSEFGMMCMNYMQNTFLKGTFMFTPKFSLVRSSCDQCSLYSLQGTLVKRDELPGLHQLTEIISEVRVTTQTTFYTHAKTRLFRFLCAARIPKMCFVKVQVHLGTYKQLLCAKRRYI